jgi:hypothetical protein
MITEYTNRCGADLARAPRNDPKLFELVRVRILRRFQLAGGAVAEVGTEIELPRFDAVSMAALKRVELL